MSERTSTAGEDHLRDARRLYQAHRNAATRPTKVKNLDKIWEVLNDIWRDGSRDYSLAEVGRRSERISGPKTQSLRNAQGAHYREVITAFAAGVSGSTRYVAKTKSNVQQALDLISDPSVRATIRLALDEAKRLKVVNDNLHAAFKTLQVGTSISNQEPATSDAPRMMYAQNAAPNQLLPRYRTALSKGVNETRLAQQGLRVASDGGIENEHGDKLFPPAFVFAIHAVLGVHE